MIAPDKSFTRPQCEECLHVWIRRESGRRRHQPRREDRVLEGDGLNYDNIYGSLNDLNIGDYLTSKEVKIERKKDGAQNVSHLLR